MTTYRSQRRLVQTISTLLIVVLPFFNIMRLDVPTLRFYFFNSVLWVDEFYLLFLVIMLVLWVIVIFSMLYGRVWCGWTCPQTVLNELYAWFEKRAKRWLRVPKTGAKLWRRVAAFSLVTLATAVISLVIGFNLVAYFVDPYRMLREAAAFSLGPITTGIIISIGLFMFVDVMFWRAKFCTKACPYGMLQAVFTDSKTQIVRYHTERNDECIECKACVRDCMMGIDIRTSPYQTECIHCGDCVDSCTTILSRLKKPLPSLISFSWGEKEMQKVTWYQKLGLVDAKRWAILGLTAVYAIVLVVVIQLRQPLSLTASGDRATLYHIADDGRIYNEYTLKISNRSMEDGWFTIACAGGETPEGGCSISVEQNPIFLHSREVKALKIAIYTKGDHFRPGPNRVELIAFNRDNAAVRTTTEAVFFMPEQAISDAQLDTQKEPL
ncbi:MAG: 4Fe-4S binding protein [Bacteroidetes bacterium]|nr:4Fe-4S binding protein [Bacteroidota bacterium]MCW5894661.1 4Fe-4S binding protein [Bacteroidota bacterium]